MLGDVEIDIDTWPWLPTCVEVEGSSVEAVESAAAKLGLDMQTALYGPVNNYYQAVYDIPENESISHTPLFFNATCPWRRK